MTYSDFAHIPYTLGIMALGILMFFVGIPVSYIAATGGMVFELSRQETKREYQIMEEKHILRAQLNTLDAWKFWNWNSHGKKETLYSAISAYGAATALFLVFGI